MDKRQLTEQEIRSRFITPAIQSAGWKPQQMREEVTFTAGRIIWRLWKARNVKRVLFLADRNILVDQARTNDFKHFGDTMAKITGRQVDKSYEVYLALYQGISGTEEWQNAYRALLSHETGKTR